MNESFFDNHNKDEYPPMHTAEHILNQTMVRMFGCGRSVNAHIERKKSKCDYFLAVEPGAELLSEVADRVNGVISQNLDVTEVFVSREEVPAGVDLSKLPDDATGTLRLVYIGDYDICACIGKHVSNTSEIGRFVIVSSDYSEGRLRIRFKLA